MPDAHLPLVRRTQRPRGPTHITPVGASEEQARRDELARCGAVQDPNDIAVADTLAREEKEP